MPTLYLIDGYAQFFRAYHAIRTPMSSPVTKEPTNMTFGFVGMLLKLLRGEGKIKEEGGTGGPDYLAVALDVSSDRGTFRSELDPEYKATRPPPPEDLFPQVERCLKLLEAVGVPTIGAETFEADDVIATIVDRLRRERPDLRIRIISKDKDLKQLLEPGRVELFDIHTDLIIDVAKLKEVDGITPRQVVDMLALMGDTSDNVKGVEGIGPKTAAQLIAQYGSLDNLIAHAAEIKGKRGENLRAALERLPLNVQLVTLRRDTPIDFDLARTDTKRLNLEALLPILRELGFNRYQDEVKALLSSPGGEGVVAGGAGAPTAIRAVPKRSQPTFIPGGLFDQPTPLASNAEPGTPSPEPHAADSRYRCCCTSAELDQVLEELRSARIISIDTETTGLSPRECHLCGICLSTKPGTGWYVPVRSPTPSEHLTQQQVVDALRPILEDPAKPKCGHNLKFDLLILRNHGINMRGLAFDSMVASYLIDASRSSHGLDSLALALLGRTNISIKDLIGTGKDQVTFDHVPLDKATMYAAEDADVALQLRNIMLPQLEAMGSQGHAGELMPLFNDIEMPLVEVLAELEWNGITVNRAELDRQRTRIQARIDDLRRRIDAAAMETIGRTFNPDSPRQLSAALFNKPTHEGEGGAGLGLKPIKKIQTGYSTDAEVLEKLAADPAITTDIPALIVEYRELTKLVSTYLVALAEAINPRTGRIHASFHQTVAITGRLASSDPNLQNIPIRTDIGREIRRAFTAAPGPPPCVLISADYSQIELRLLAHLSRDPGLIEAFHAGQDIHTAVAAQIHGIPIEQVSKAQRSGAKMVNFGIVYGITAFGLARRLNIGNSEAAAIIDDYKRRFSGITTFLQECIEQARSLGYVETMLKRRRPIPDIDSTNPSRRALAERTAINSVVQGSAADLIKIAMVDLHARLSPYASHLGERGGTPAELPNVSMLLQIHDELVFEAPKSLAEEARALIISRMEAAMTLTVPLKVDASIATNWFEGR